MNDLHADLIHRYLDDSITRAEFETLQKELEHSETLRQEFVRVSLLHDLLSQELFEPNVVTPGPTQQFGLPQQPAPQPSSQRWKLIATWGPLASLILFFVGFLAFLPNPNRSQLFASQELSRILRSIPTADRLYGLDVETVALPNRIGRRGSETDRPPKPSLEGAQLFVRGNDQFVLKRTLDDGRSFITGSDGKTSWAIAPDGPVRVSKDTGRFNRDLPGHEHAIPLVNLSQGIAKIQKAYECQIIQGSPVDVEEQVVDPLDNNERQSTEVDAVLVATKKRGERGPKRIEIQYNPNSGRIAQLRFVEMPYGPERITVRLTLLDEKPLDTYFFTHNYHHSNKEEVVDDDR